jgi:hypothetical protein
MNSMRILLIVAALVLAPKNVSADWQFTKWDTQWGMTPDQALAASKGALQECDPKVCDGRPWLNSQAQFHGTYEDGGFLFKGVAYFDREANKLRRINLALKQHEKTNASMERLRGDILFEALRRRYGAPHGQTWDLTFRRWRLGTDVVRLYTGTFIAIHYEDPSADEP